MAAAWQAVAPAVSSSRRLGSRVLQALLDEARLTPKPGLVDARGSGSHADLDLALMSRSARVLEAWYVAMAEAGLHAGVPTLALRETLGQLGRDGEAAMLRATGGVNTHRGAIWALGLLVAAAAMQAPGRLDAERIAQVAGAIATLPDRHAPLRSGHKGEQACRDFGVGGARGQAQAGFPLVIGCALPELRRSRARGDSETASRLNALLALIARLDDTCVLSRAGASGLLRLQAGASGVLSAGGAASLAGRIRLKQLDAEALACRASPGGAADLLAATLFLDGLEGRSDAEA